jgi:hypothetical protein
MRSPTSHKKSRLKGILQSRAPTKARHTCFPRQRIKPLLTKIPQSLSCWKRSLLKFSGRKRFKSPKASCLNKKNRYGLVSPKRLRGSIVKVINLDSDFLEVESEGFSGKIAVEKTDFWQRAESARKAAIERQNREKEITKAREQREKERKIDAARLEKYENATKLEIEIVQILDEGCLATVLENDNWTRKRIFIELRGSVAEGQRYEVRAEQSGTFSYKTVLGAPSTVERWTPIMKR